MGSDRHEGARRIANARIGFLIHASVYVSGALLVLWVVPFYAAMIVLLAWGVFLGVQAVVVFAVPPLRRRWIADEVAAAPRVDARHARALEELSAAVAHEIRNPITAARSLLQQIVEAPDAPERVEYAKVALAELERVERSVAHLLRFAREEELALTDVRFGEVIDTALATPAIATRVDALRVSVKRSVDGDGRMRGDPEKLGRVLINLLSNALDALEQVPEGARRLEVSAGTNLAGSEAWLRVRDSGPGIAPERLARVFVPFHTSKEKGTGLGLAISKKLVTAHGGTIEARSPAGQGAEFLLTFPRSVA